MRLALGGRRGSNDEHLAAHVGAESAGMLAAIGAHLRRFNAGRRFELCDVARPSFERARQTGYPNCWLSVTIGARQVSNCWPLSEKFLPW